jgi:hypothetical protein
MHPYFFSLLAVCSKSEYDFIMDQISQIHLQNIADQYLDPFPSMNHKIVINFGLACKNIS